MVPKLSTQGSYSLRKLWAISSRFLPSRSQRQIVPAWQSVSLLVHLRPLPSSFAGLHALVADAEIELAVGPDQDAVDAVIVIDAAEAGEQLLRRAVGLAVAVLVLEDQNVGRLADEDLVAGADGVLGDGDAERRQDLRRLVEDGAPCRLCRSLGVFEDEDAIALRPVAAAFCAACGDS